MPNIILCVPPVPGPVNASLKIAKDLRSRGHKIWYLGIPDVEDYVRPSGFNFLPVFPEWFPKGYLESTKQIFDLSGLQRFREARRQARLFETFFHGLIHDSISDFKAIVKETHPDLFLISSSTYDSAVWALLAYECGVQCAYLNDTLTRKADSIVPPITTGIIPDDSVYSTARVSAAWASLLIKKFIFTKAYIIAGLFPDWLNLIRRLAAKCDYPWRQIETTNLVSPKLLIPELVLIPEDFDFPGAQTTGRYYVGASIDLESKDDNFPWDRINQDEPIIYCALGTISHHLTKREYKTFFEAVFDAVRLLPGHQLIVAVGDSLDPEEFAGLPSNIVIVKRAPQIDILKRASLMITHGGINTVKECVFFGVPMIVFPLGFDQPGTAARVVRHGLGLVGNIRKTSAGEIRSMIESLEKSPYYRAQVRLMSQRFREVEDAMIGVKIVETIVGKACEPGAATRFVCSGDAENTLQEA